MIKQLFKIAISLMVAIPMFLATANAQCTNTCAAGLVTQSVDLPLAGAGFANDPGVLVAYDPNIDGIITGNTGANDVFAGVTYTLGDLSGFSNLCLTADFDVSATFDLAAFPLVLEFRIENACGAFPCPWVDFFTTVSAPGPITIGGDLITGNNTGWDPTVASQIVVSYANFTGTPLPGDLSISWTNMSLQGCAANVASCPDCPAGTTSTAVPLTPAQIGFNDGSGNATDDGSTIFAAAGSDAVFAGSTFSTAGFASNDLNSICMIGDFELIAGFDLNAFPVVLEYRIQNLCGTFPCPWIDFYTTVNAAGTYPIGDLLSAGNNTGFDPTMPSEVVVSYANFAGPLPGDVTINYSNLAVSECVSDVVVPATCLACDASCEVQESIVMDTPFSIFCARNLWRRN